MREEAMAAESISLQNHEVNGSFFCLGLLRKSRSLAHMGDAIHDRGCGRLPGPEACGTSGFRVEGHNMEVQVVTARCGRILG